MQEIAKYVVYTGLFLIPALTLLVTSNLFFPYITGKNFGFRILVEIILAAYIVWACYEPAVRPKVSYIFYSFSALVVVTLLSTIFAQSTSLAFWSNFERMDGFVNLVHVFAFFFVLGNVFAFNKKLLNIFLNVSLAIAAFVSLKAIADASGSVGTVRLEGTLGNAAYLAIYTLFHAFFAVLMFLRSEKLWARIFYALSGLLFVYVLIQTSTRGTAIALAVGLLSSTVYVALFATKAKEYRRLAAGALLVLLLLAGTFMLVKEHDFVQESQTLARIANIDLREDLAIRSVVWGLAYEGFKDRPILGWGNGNFNYVFNEKYQPALYAQEPWFDRAHNIVLDWMVAGGILGILAFVSLMLSTVYYLVVMPLRGRDIGLTVLERAVLFGLLVGYLTHNLVVFDNLISYIFLAVFLALMHAQVAKALPKLENYKFDQSLAAWVVVPVVVCLLGTIYYINIPAYKNAKELVLAMGSVQSSQSGLTAQLKHFEAALDTDSFGYRETLERLLQAGPAYFDGNSTNELANAYIALADGALEKTIERFPGDARLHFLAASHYRVSNRLEQAKVEADRARELSPQKFTMAVTQGVLAYDLGDNEAALRYFEEAYRFEENNINAASYYLSGLFLNDRTEEAEDLYYSNPELQIESAKNSFLIFTAVNAGSRVGVEMMRERLERDSSNLQNYVLLANALYRSGEKAEAITVLDEVVAIEPTTAEIIGCYVANIRAGRTLDEDCV